MKNIKFIILPSIALMVLFTISGCHKKTWILPPNHSLKMGFADTNYIFSRFPRENISFNYYSDSLVYYFDNEGTKIYRNYIIIATLDEYPYYYLSIGGIAEMSSQNNLKYLYIDWPNGPTDTLYTDYYRDTKGPNSCSCSDPLNELKLNGKSYTEKTDYDINGVYVWEFK